MNKIIVILLLITSCLYSNAQLVEQHSVYFDVDKDTFITTEGKDLNSFFDQLLYKPILDVKILGYCDDRGSYKYNLDLSNRRVETVSNWLQQHDITVEHISKTIEGRGEVALKEDNTSIKNERAQNRRVDVVFSLEKKVADKLAIKKLNKKDLNDAEASQIVAYEKKVIAAIEKNTEIKKIALPQKENFKEKASGKENSGDPNYLDIPTKIDPPIDNSTEPFKSLLSKNLKKGQVIRLENILFYKGRSTILEESQPLLDRVAEILVARKDIRFEIHGHVCCINPAYPDAYNRDTKKSRLSHDRAKAIYRILNRRGVNSSRMRFKGYGRTRPLGGIDKLDRRVELFITKIDPVN